MAASGVPHVTITAIGATGSGKTTYLLGMYHILANSNFGGKQYSVNADSPDTDVDLQNGWLELKKRGLLPKATSDRPVTYDMTLSDASDELLSFSWTDYRGEALHGRSDDPDHADTPDLLARLSDSDSIYVLIDGSVLRTPLAEADQFEVEYRVRSGRISYLLRRVFKERRESGRALPSVVLLVTKSDLLDDGNGTATLERVVEDAKQLFPVCFEAGTRTLICPVEVGRFGGVDAERVDPATVAPRWLHKPMLFSLMDYLAREYEDYDSQTNEVRQQVAQAADHKKESLIASLATGAVVGTVVGFPGTGTLLGATLGIVRWRRNTKAKNAVKSGTEQIESRTPVGAKMRERVQALVDEISTVPLYLDGVRQEADA